MANTISNNVSVRWLRQLRQTERGTVIAVPRKASPDSFSKALTLPSALDPASMHELFGGTVDTPGLEKFSGPALLDELRRRFFAKHHVLDYSTARKLMFTVVDNEGGSVRDVYTGRKLDHVTQIPRADGAESFNTEHTWPQSQLKRAGREPATTDLHHLFPVDTDANGKRGSFPFGVVQTVMWQRGESLLGRDASGEIVFQPPPKHRGDVARAMFWIATAYGLQIPDAEEKVLREWAGEDPVDPHEQERNVRIEKVQGDLNPFVVEPELFGRVVNF